jgi:moderate conductance mechanosensitive channel
MIPFTQPMQIFQQTDTLQVLLNIGFVIVIAGVIRLLSNPISSFYLVFYQLSPRHRNLSIERETLVWVIGLFSAAFGFGARPIISDIMAGLAFMAEDNFAVGDKVEIFSSVGLGGIQGVVESVNLRTTFLRSTTGELYLIPNSELRIVRNFSRGRFSTVKITLCVSSTDLSNAIALLENLREDAVLELPNLLEPWQIISENHQKHKKQRQLQ